ncbi:hypothetical protein [Acidovorax sp. NCPPB 3576]|uniref:hypothetical protein n=1 Tax=Acidovorax sp. NCPPB 3576 TaxID=2940488 RepID=UPI00234BA630|nr:hypothetical protein [Acidovorax sp. NCPPB 3576]WCM88857.1 hypothetical protein M5C98_02035 [Acidovorax sp. NCPPB 3576]
MPNTDYSALECAPSGSRRARWVYVMHQAIVIGGMLGGGMSVGYFAGVQTTREDANAEIERLQGTHKQALEVIAGRQASTAVKLAAVADTAATAAETAKDAADTAATAATTAGKAAKAAGVPAAALENDRKAINTTITRANQRIKEGGAR